MHQRDAIRPRQNRHMGIGRGGGFGDNAGYIGHFRRDGVRDQDVEGLQPTLGVSRGNLIGGEYLRVPIAQPWA